MNRHELHELLIEEGVDPRAFDVLGSDPDPIPDNLYLLRLIRSGIVGKPDYWSVYYSERGGRFGIRNFSTESEACAHFLSVIIRDPTTSR